MNPQTSDSLREKRPNAEVFLIGIFLYSIRIQENTDQKELRIWALFTQCKDFPEMTGRYVVMMFVAKKIGLLFSTALAEVLYLLIMSHGHFHNSEQN